MQTLRSRSILALCLVLPANIAAAGPTYEGPNGGAFDYYGHLNFAFVSVDDSFTTNDFFADNGISTSRFGFNMRQPFGENTFHFQFETALGIPSSFEFDNDPTTSDPSWDWQRTDLRIVDFSLNGNWGTFYAGQGSTASDGIAEVDLSGVGLTTYIGISETAGSFLFRDATSALTGVDIGDAFKNFDGNSRKGRIRYDSPSFSGFKIKTSLGEEILKKNVDETFWDAALTFENDFDGTEIEAALGYFSQDRNGTKNDFVAGSASVKLRNGLNFTVSAADKDTNGSYYYAKVGYIAEFFQFGSTAFGLDYYNGDDLHFEGTSTSSASESIGFGVTQKIDDHNSEIYFGYRDHSFSDNSGTAYADADSFIFGARWKF